MKGQILSCSGAEVCSMKFATGCNRTTKDLSTYQAGGGESLERIPSSDVHRYNLEVLRGNNFSQKRKRGGVPLIHKAQ